MTLMEFYQWKYSEQGLLFQEQNKNKFYILDQKKKKTNQNKIEAKSKNFFETRYALGEFRRWSAKR